MYRVMSGLIGAALLAGCTSLAHLPLSSEPSPCANVEKIGYFNPASDVFVGHFDSKPDVDDLHTIAAVGTVLSEPQMACVKAVAVAGAYGTQGGEYIGSPELFDLAFGDDWLDGHNERDATVHAQAELFVETLGSGGHVWIMIAGQGDIAADALTIAMRLSPDLPYKTNLHLVQHSDWNESVTAPTKLAFLQAHTDYRKIPDGNAGGNGTPKYTSNEGALWGRVLADPVIGPVWSEAKRLADIHNPGSAYVNPYVEAGGFDFSDTVEMAHMFGFNDLDTVDRFFDVRLASTSHNQTKTWPNGAKAAIALTYDDALDSQLENAVPQLETYGFKATFYVSMAFDDFEEQREKWAALADQGHELGNHTLVHPCQASKSGRDWVIPARDLDQYTKARFINELKAANKALNSMDGETVRTFAYTCGDTEAGGESFIEDVKPLFLGARSVARDVPFDPYFMPSFSVRDTPGVEMIAYVDELIRDGKVGTITFHGIGGDHLAVTTEAHAELLAYLDESRSDVWVASLRDILLERSRD